MLAATLDSALRTQPSQANPVSLAGVAHARGRARPLAGASTGGDCVTTNSSTHRTPVDLLKSQSSPASPRVCGTRFSLRSEEGDPLFSKREVEDPLFSKREVESTRPLPWRFFRKRTQPIADD